MSLSFEGLVGLVKKGFASASIATPAALRDDELIRTAARNIYDVIPFPLNLAIKMSVGIEGLERFALSLRDAMLAAGVSDLSRLSQEQVRAVVARALASVPSLGGMFDLGVAKPAASGDASGAPLPSVEQQQQQQQARAAVRPKIWYLIRDNAQWGPWSDQEFLSLAEQGRLEFADQVWREGMPGWIAVRDLPVAAGAEPWWPARVQ